MNQELEDRVWNDSAGITNEIVNLAHDGNEMC